MYQLQKWLQFEGVCLHKVKKTGRAYYVTEANLMAFLEREKG